ncbi:hypothetical protein SBV1_2640003 [Verrucomicrobia bacterium]|nr:hypothetical protein SBV1_2640003 [Verrucomicrobiota bacterium]
MRRNQPVERARGKLSWPLFARSSVSVEWNANLYEERSEWPACCCYGRQSGPADPPMKSSLMSVLEIVQTERVLDP